MNDLENELTPGSKKEPKESLIKLILFIDLTQNNNN